jgi:xanthine dehydrogenase accessory factor
MIGHKQDQPRGTTACTAWPTNRGSGYVAFGGAERKAAAVRRVLAAGGVNAEALTRVRAPAGPDIGAVTSEEIALSIIAKMVGVRRRGRAVRRPLHTGRSQG